MSEINYKNGIDEKQAIELLSLDPQSKEVDELLQFTGRNARERFGNRGYIFLQYGLDYASCSGNCRFCTFGRDSFCGTPHRKTADEFVRDLDTIDFSRIDSFFLMTTEDYSRTQFLKFIDEAKKIIPPGVKLVANTGDFDYEYAKELRSAGVYAAYHIVRLNEAKDTDFLVHTRVRTIESLIKAGLRLYYCIEPIGVEHSDRQIVDEMMRARDYDVDVMAVMRRVNVPNGPYAGLPEVTDRRMFQIAATTYLYVQPGLSMNIHETIDESLKYGVNQIYAEWGANPRDTNGSTQLNRGRSVENVARLLTENGYNL